MLCEVDTGTPVGDVLSTILGEERRPSNRPWIMINMVTSIDGGTAVEGGSTPLSDDDDRTVFRALRAAPDAILVGAGTVRAEDYRPVVLDEERVDARLTRGLTPSPRLVIVSGSLDLDPEARVFSDPEARPMVLTGTGANAGADAGASRRHADASRRQALEEVADVVEVGSEDGLDGHAIVAALSGFGVVLCEGGPRLNGSLFAAGVVDEINWTVAPKVLAGSGPRMAVAENLDPPVDYHLSRMWRGDTALFLRYLR